MSNLSTANGTEISSLIGALELGDHLESYGDGALLLAAETTMSAPPHTAGSCTLLRGTCATDSMLEAAAGPSPMTQNLSCPTIIGCPH